MLAPGLRYLTPEQVADVLAVNQQTVRKWLREGRLRGQRVGRLWRVPVGALEGGVGKAVAAARTVREYARDHDNCI